MNVCVPLLCNTMANEVSVWFQSGQTGRISYRPFQQNMTFNAKWQRRRLTCTKHNARQKRILKRERIAMAQLHLGTTIQQTQKNMHLTSVYTLTNSLTHIQLDVVAFITFFQSVSILKPSVECLLCSFSVFFGLVVLYAKEISCHAHIRTWFLFAWKKYGSNQKS